MEELLKKLILAGIGALELTREKAEEVIEELFKRGKIVYQEKKNLLQELAKRGEEQKERLEKVVEKVVERVISRTTIATKNDIKKLEEKLEKLEKKIK